MVIRGLHVKKPPSTASCHACAKYSPEQHRRFVLSPVIEVAGSKTKGTRINVMNALGFKNMVSYARTNIDQ